MKKILVTIPIYGMNNLEFFKRQLHNLLLVGSGVFSLDIHLFLNQIERISFENEIDKIKFITGYDNTTHNLILHYWEEDLGKMLPYECRVYMDSVDDIYDYYLYIEDDLLIQEHNLITYDLVNNLLNDSNYVTGFLRYEEDGIDIISYPDLNGMHSVNRGGDGYQIIKSKIIHNNVRYFEPWNIHSSCFMFNRKQMNFFKKEGCLVVMVHEYFQEIETLGSNLYLEKFTKVYPVDDNLLNGLTIHHMPNKYIYWRDSPTKETLNNLLGKR